MDDLKIREVNFHNYLLTFTEKYSLKCIEDFFDYWSEPNKSGSKMKYEMEPTWDTERRLRRWVQNQRKWQPQTAHKLDFGTEGKFTFDKM